MRGVHEDAKERQMRIAHVTNYWPNHLGHAHYTQNLMAAIHALRPERQFVIVRAAAVDATP